MSKTLLDNIRERKEDQRVNAVKELGIFELRGLGRELGIVSPTTRKRDELVSLILDKLTVGVQTTPEQSKNKKGRPCKQLKNLDEIMSIMTGATEENRSIITATKRIRPYNEIITFAQETPIFNMAMSEKFENFEGVLRISAKVGYFLDRKNARKIFVPLDMIEENKLKMGDYLQVVAKMINLSEQYIVSKIVKINFVKAEDYQLESEAEKQPMISFNAFNYGDFQLFRGRRSIICYKNHLFEDPRFVTFAEKMIADGFKFVMLGLNTGFEDAIMFSNIEGGINLCTGYGTDYQIGLDKVVDTISLVSRLVERGEKVVLFVSDILEIMNSLDLCFDGKNNILGHTAEAVVIGQKLISLGKAFKDGSEVSVVMTYRDLNSDDQFLINEIFKVSTKFE